MAPCTFSVRRCVPEVLDRFSCQRLSKFTSSCCYISYEFSAAKLIGAKSWMFEASFRILFKPPPAPAQAPFHVGGEQTRSRQPARNSIIFLLSKGFSVQRRGARKAADNCDPSSAIGTRNPLRISNSIGLLCRIISTTNSSPAKNSKASDIPRWNRAISDSSQESG